MRRTDALKLEITEMFSISMSHMRPSTNDWLADRENKGLTRYEKGEYGWIIWAGGPDAYHCERNDTSSRSNGVPNEITLAAQFAMELGCQWLCFDRDAAPVDGLILYDECWN